MKSAEREEARRLRCGGWSIKDIAATLRVSKGSVSAWVADIKMTEEQVRALEARQSRSRRYILDRVRQLTVAAVARNENFRQNGFQKAETDERFRLICALYWGEGRKCERNKAFAISNSDPNLLRIVLRWLLDAGFGEKLSFRVQYYADNGLSEREIAAWWQHRLPGLETRHFRKFTRNVVNRASQRKKIGRLPFGTAVLQVRSTELFCTIMGGIDYLSTSGA